MKKSDSLSSFMEGIEMTVLPQEEQILLGASDIGISGNNLGNCPTVNNCNGGNCAKGCGSAE